MTPRRCQWITGVGSANKINHCLKPSTHTINGWRYYCEGHARKIKTLEDGIYRTSVIPISRWRRIIEYIKLFIPGIGKRMEG